MASSASGSLLVHLVWPVAAAPAGANAAAPPVRLTPEAVELLRPYLTRYAQTLKVIVHAVGGGAGDRLHVLLDLPPERALTSVVDELQRTSARFLRDARSLSGFAWRREAAAHESVGPERLETLAADIAANGAGSGPVSVPRGDTAGAQDDGNDEAPLPEWLREVLDEKGTGR